MRTTRKIDTIKCDNCGRLEDNPKNWLSLSAHFDLQGHGAYSNGAINSQITAKHYDFCTIRCAELERNKLLTIIPGRL